MLAFLITILVTALVAALIWYLHGNQLRTNREIADQTAPLPPLEDTGAGLQTIRVAPELASGPGAAPLPWQDEVKALRDEGKFQEAIQLCRRQYPKMLAFRQTLITLRANIRQEPEASGETLENLYRTAIFASIAKAEKQDAGHVDIGELSTRFTHPREYWNRLGYRNLELLNKQDRRLLTESWGEPERHADINELL